MECSVLLEALASELNLGLGLVSFPVTIDGIIIQNLFLEMSLWNSTYVRDHRVAQSLPIYCRHNLISRPVTAMAISLYPRIVPPVARSVTAAMTLAYVDFRRARTSLRCRRMTAS